MNRCFSWCWKPPWLHPDQPEFRDFLQWSSWHFQFVRCKYYGCRASQLPIPWPPPIILCLVRDDLVVMPVIPSMLLLSQCYVSGVECVLTTIDPLFSKFRAEREFFWKPPWQPPIPNTRSEIQLLIEFVHLTTGVCDTLHMVTEFSKQYFVGLLVLITRENFTYGRIVFAQGELKFSVKSSHHTMQFSGECQGHPVLTLLDSGSSHSFVRTSMADKLSGVSQLLTHILVHVIDGGIIAYNQKFNPTTLALQPSTCPFCRATITRLRVVNSGTNHAATSNGFKGQTSAIRSLSLSRIGHGFSVGPYKDINKDGKPYIQVKMKDGQNKISAMKDTADAYLGALILTTVATSSASTTGIGVSDPYGRADSKGCSLKQQHADWISSFRVHVILSQFLDVAASETRNGVCAAHDYRSDSLDQQDGIVWPFGRHDEKWHRGHKCNDIVQLHALQKVWDLLAEPAVEETAPDESQPGDVVVMAISSEAFSISTSLQVQVANGSLISWTSVLSQAAWNIQGYCFTHDKWLCIPYEGIQIVLHGCTSSQHTDVLLHITPVDSSDSAVNLGITSSTCVEGIILQIFNATSVPYDVVFLSALSMSCVEGKSGSQPMPLGISGAIVGPRKLGYLLPLIGDIVTALPYLADGGFASWFCICLWKVLRPSLVQQILWLISKKSVGMDLFIWLRYELIRKLKQRMSGSDITGLFRMLIQGVMVQPWGVYSQTSVQLWVLVQLAQTSGNAILWTVPCPSLAISVIITSVMYCHLFKKLPWQPLNQGAVHQQQCDTLCQLEIVFYGKYNIYNQDPLVSHDVIKNKFTTFPWNPGASRFYIGLGASRSLRRGECHTSYVAGQATMSHILHRRMGSSLIASVMPTSVPEGRSGVSVSLAVGTGIVCGCDMGSSLSG
jgi:hypothetical protein